MSKSKKNKNSKVKNRQKSKISVEPVIETEVPIEETQMTFETPPKKFMPTLPNYFKSLIDREINLENQEPRAVIEQLGECLGITDYKSNIAAFWFLDTLADQVLKHTTNFDGFYRSIFVSWLAGEIKIITEGNPTRETFLSKMNKLFSNMNVKLEFDQILPHWEELFTSNIEEIFHYTSGEINYLKKSESSIENTIYQEDSPLNMKLKNSLDEIENDYEIEEINLQSKNVPKEVLRAISEATFEMYGGVLRYSLIQAAFVDPIEIHTFVLPFTLRKPRKIKQSDFNKKEKPEKKLIKDKKDPKERKNTETGKLKKKFETVSPPPPSLTEEEILFQKREYILPLMESIEAQEILQSDNV